MRSDEELIVLYRKGSREAFEELFARHHRRIVQFAFRMIGNPARAEEAAQEIFLRIARGASDWKQTARFSTWMYTIARRTTLNYIRDQKEEGARAAVPLDEESAEGSPPLQLQGPSALNPEEMAWSGEIRERFVDALQRLPESHRAAFVLNRGDGLSYEEVASVLGITTQAVKSRIFRAREMLLEYLAEVLP